MKVITGGEDVIALDSTGIVAADTGRAVAIVGVEDIVVIDTADALLVTRLDRAQDVKKVVEALDLSGRTDLT
jgi:mannose-1-phosphate guanylyltransferase